MGKLRKIDFVCCCATACCHATLQRLEFSLTNDENGAQCTLKLTNVLSDSSVAFKVKTTKPRRYLVKPNQGLVKPNSSETVVIQLLPPEKKAILADYAANGVWDDSNKFLVQSIVVGADFVGEYDAADAKDQSTQVRADGITSR